MSWKGWTHLVSSMSKKMVKATGLRIQADKGSWDWVGPSWGNTPGPGWLSCRFQWRLQLRNTLPGWLQFSRSSNATQRLPAAPNLEHTKKDTGQPKGRDGRNRQWGELKGRQFLALEKSRLGLGGTKQGKAWIGVGPWLMIDRIWLMMVTECWDWHP